MSSVCVSKCVNDTTIPIRANYVNLQKCPKSDAEFVKKQGSTSMPKFSGGRQWHYMHPRVVDSSISCRQMYLRNAYTFSRKKTVPEKTKKCFGKVKQKVVTNSGRMMRPFRPRRRRKRRVLIVKKVKEFSCEAFCSIFQKLLSCTATVDVVEQNYHNH